MTTKHTPGPWYTRHGQISSETSPHGCTIANCNKTSRGISDAEVNANAALIAAAPTLADVLLEVRNFWIGGDCPDALMARIDAVLSKAGVL